MPTAVENRDRWSQHKWAQQGDEWSPGRSPEGTELLWYRTIFPRIRRFVPSGTILEIGPGFGRWTQFLRQLCNRLIVVDLVDRCIESCRERFAEDRHIEYIVNDGASLAMIPDGSVDFIFSFDSLVHAEADAVGAYLAQAARKLTPNGAGFIHHSNLAAFVNPRTGAVRRFVTKRNWRAESMSAEVFRQQCDAAGLTCRSQSYQLDRPRATGRSPSPGWALHPAHRLSVRFQRLAGSHLATAGHRESRVRRGVAPGSLDGCGVWRSRPSSDGVPCLLGDADEGREGGAFVRKLATARKVLHDNGPVGVGALAWNKAAAAGEFTMSAVKARLMGEANRWFSRRLLIR